VSLRCLLGLASGVALLLVGAEAHAFFPERYIVCRANEPAGAAPAPEKPKLPENEPLPRRKRPLPLEVAPLEVADVSTQDPIPSGHRDRQLDPPPRVVVMREASNDFRCIGIPRGKAGILRVVGAPPGAKFARHQHPDSWIEDNVDAAAAFDLREAVPLLRRTLERPISSSLLPWAKFGRIRLQTAAARGLADFNETSSVPLVLALARGRENEDVHGAYRDSLAALARLDKVVAHDYAVEALGRLGAGAELGTRETNRLVELLPLITREDPKARAALETVSKRLDPKGSGGGFQSCRVYAARIRAGDVAIRDGFRKELSVDLVTNRATVCYSETMEAAFLGRDASEVPTLLYRHRYEALLSFVKDTQRSRSTDPAVLAALSSIRAWLDKRKTDPDVALDRSDRRFQAETRALHLAIAAALGDKLSERALFELVADPKDDGTAPWVAAAAAMDLDLAGAADHAVKRVQLALTQHTTRHKRDSWPERGRVHVTEHVEVIDRLAARDDGRFVLGLLDRHAFVREATVHWLARKRPKGACKLVTDNARGAEERAVQDAFWALSVLGESCHASFRERFEDQREPAAVRGMALEALAMLKDATIAAPVARKSKADDIRPARERAAIILHSPE